MQRLTSEYSGSKGYFVKNLFCTKSPWEGSSIHRCLNVFPGPMSQCLENTVNMGPWSALRANSHPEMPMVLRMLMRLFRPAQVPCHSPSGKPSDPSSFQCHRGWTLEEGDLLHFCLPYPSHMQNTREGWRAPFYHIIFPGPETGMSIWNEMHWQKPEGKYKCR